MTKWVFIFACIFGLSCGMPVGSQVPSGYPIIKPGDATIEILSPKSKQIFEPGSTIEVETRTQMHGRKLKAIIISGDGIAPIQKKLTAMQLVSIEGDVYRHRFTLKNAPLNNVYSNLMVQVADDRNAVSVMDVGYLVKERPRVRINSLTDGQTFVNPDRITISIDEVPNRSRGDDEFCIVIDGLEEATYPRGGPGIFYWQAPRPGTHTIQILVRFTDIELSRSELLTVNVK